VPRLSRPRLRFVTALLGVDVPGEREAPETFHVTLVYFGRDRPFNDLIRAAVIASSVCKDFDPFKCQVHRVVSFDPGDKGYPIVGRIESQQINELWTVLRTAYDEHGFEYSKKWPNFTPHVTLSYSPVPLKAPILLSSSVTGTTLRGGAAVVWNVNDLMLLGDGTPKEVISIPLARSPMEWML
jgi:2'-5' RNA ligase